MSSVVRDQIPETHNGPIIKLGGGELGGKARGLGFLAAQLQLFELATEFAPHRILVPETTVLATDQFDLHLERHGLWNLVGLPDEEIRRAFLGTPVSPELEAALRRYVLAHRRPIAVRSSSLSEDAHDHPFAGVYETFMLPNNAPEVDDRVRQLSEAVRLQWANVLCADPVRYMKAHGIPCDSEKMAVVLEEVVGRDHGGVYYPLCSGVAQSYNFFPIGRQRAEDGMAALAFGLGKRAVDDEDSLRFSPGAPLVRPAASTPAELVRGAQRAFYAVDMQAWSRHLTGSDMDTLLELRIAEAEGHGTLPALVSTWVVQDQTLYEGTARDGVRVPTFHRLLRGELFPLPSLIARLLKITSEGLGRAVEIEFALTIDQGEAGARGSFFLLQARPMAALSHAEATELPEVAAGRVLLRSSRAMGHGSRTGIRNLVFVDPAGFSVATSHEAAREIATLNDELSRRREPYVLLAPGRLGTRNAALGIPVTFPQVAGAAALVEMSTEDFAAEPSQGTHFFHNVVSRGVLYMAVDAKGGDPLDLEWLRAHRSQPHGPVRHLVVDPPLEVRVVGTRQLGIVYRAEGETDAEG